MKENKKNQQKNNLIQILKILKKDSKNWNLPILELQKIYKNSPFKVLITTILSLRNRDEQTIKSSKKLFKVLKTPKDINLLDSIQIQKIIYPTGFSYKKSIQITNICKNLNKNFNSKVPSNLDELLSFKGIGLKTANLVLSEGFNIKTICVDTHVLRISNRLGLIKTKNPYDVENYLKKSLSKKYWKEVNFLFVSFGQNICRPISPFCSKCKINKFCKKVNVKISR